MKTRTFVTLVFAMAFVAQAHAAATNTHQHILKLRYLLPQPNASAPAAIKDVVSTFGGKVDLELPDRVVVSIPDAAVKALRQNGRVKYMQRVVTGPFAPDPTAATASTPVAAQSLRPVVESNPPTWSSGTYLYDSAGNIRNIGSDAYVYDHLSRLKEADIGTHVETYGYDVFGNLISKSTDGQQSPPLTVGPPGTNRLATQSYDVAGNAIGDGSQTYKYDPFNMRREKDVPAANTSEYYIYDASDERIGVITCQPYPMLCTNGNTLWKWSLRDEEGKVLRQLEVPLVGSWPWVWVEDYVYRDGLLLGGERPAEEGGRRHFHIDHLGSPRLVTGDTTGKIAEHDYYPFGVEINPPGLRQETANGLDREEPMKFTGHERDFNVGTNSENVNYDDYMHARYDVPQWGRFLSPDPVLGDPRVPQSWNRYAYVQNNPINHTDPTGTEDKVPQLDNIHLVLATNYDRAAEFLTDLQRGISDDITRYQLLGAPPAVLAPAQVLADTVETVAQGLTTATETGNAIGSGASTTQVALAIAHDANKAAQFGALLYSVAEIVTSPATETYKRPAGATTAEQRAAVQGKPCAVCDLNDGGKRIAGHAEALVQEHYRTGTIDKVKMRNVNSVRPECPTCSAREGGRMSRFSKRMKELLGF